MQYKTNKEIENEFEKEFSIDFLNLKKDFKEAILSQRKQDREAIREMAMEKSYRKKVFGKKFLELTDLLSFLDRLEGE